VLDHHRRLTSDPLFNPDFVQIVDCRQVRSVKDLSAQSIGHVASLAMFSDHSRRVTVTDQLVLAGFARMLAIYRDCSGGKEAIPVVNTWEEATDWLWTPPDKV